MNRCYVQFVCTGSKGFCNFYKDIIIKPARYHNGCEHFANGYCTNKKAQTATLVEEGFEIKEGDKMKSTQIITTIVDGRVSVRCVGDVTTPEKMQALATAELIVAEGRDKAGE